MDYLNYPLKEGGTGGRLKEKRDYFFATFQMWDSLTHFFNGYMIKRKISKENGVKINTYFKTVNLCYYVLIFLAQFNIGIKQFIKVN